jgi:hypothetical protein
LRSRIFLDFDSPRDSAVWSSRNIRRHQVLGGVSMIGVDFWVGRGKQDLGYSLGSRSCVVSEVRRVEVWSGSGSLVRGGLGDLAPRVSLVSYTVFG